MKETLEEAAGKSFEEIWASLTTEQSEYLKGYINKKVDEAKKWQAERMYSEEEVIRLLQMYRCDLSAGVTPNIGDTTPTWFEQFKKQKENLK